MERESERPMSEDQFLAWAEGREGRYELVEGRVTLRTYAVFDPKRPRAFLWERSGDGWPEGPALVEGEAAEVAFPVVGARLRLADIYRAVPG